MFKFKNSFGAKTYARIRPVGSRSGVMYGLPKIHKKDAPIRPIISSIGTYTWMNEFERIHANSNDFEWNRMNSQSEFVRIRHFFCYRFLGPFLHIIKKFMLLIQFLKFHMNSNEFMQFHALTKYEIVWICMNLFEFNRIHSISIFFDRFHMNFFVKIYFFYFNSFKRSFL